MKNLSSAFSLTRVSTVENGIEFIFSSCPEAKARSIQSVHTSATIVLCFIISRRLVKRKPGQRKNCRKIRAANRHSSLNETTFLDMIWLENMFIRVYYIFPDPWMNFYRWYLTQLVWIVTVRFWLITLSVQPLNDKFKFNRKLD